VATVDAAAWERLTLAERVVPPARAADAHALIAAALRSGATVSAAIAGGATAVALAVTAPDFGLDAGPDGDELLALGVAPAWRRRGLGGRLLRTHVAARGSGRPLRATVGVAERDVVEPLDRALRIDIARRLLSAAGMEVTAAPDRVGRLDPPAITAVRR
jgi:ribosomal protein S18 acetylase RimI-like enzyme